MCAGRGLAHRHAGGGERGFVEHQRAGDAADARRWPGRARASPTPSVEAVDHVRGSHGRSASWVRPLSARSTRSAARRRGARDRIPAGRAAPAPSLRCRRPASLPSGSRPPASCRRRRLGVQPLDRRQLTPDDLAVVTLALPVAWSRPPRLSHVAVMSPDAVTSMARPATRPRATRSPSGPVNSALIGAPPGSRNRPLAVSVPCPTWSDKSSALKSLAPGLEARRVVEPHRHAAGRHRHFLQVDEGVEAGGVAQLAFERRAESDRSRDGALDRSCGQRQ